MTPRVRTATALALTPALVAAAVLSVGLSPQPASAGSLQGVVPVVAVLFFQRRPAPPPPAFPAPRRPPARPTAEMMFAAFDRNGDGVLEREEFAALHAAGLGRLVLADWAGRVDGLTVFVFIDSNQDGVVSAAEFRVHARPGVR